MARQRNGTSGAGWFVAGLAALLGIAEHGQRTDAERELTLLRADLDAARREAADERSRRAGLELTVSQLRTERDQALRECDEARRERDQTRRERDELRGMSPPSGG